MGNRITIHRGHVPRGLGTLGVQRNGSPATVRVEQRNTFNLQRRRERNQPGLGVFK